MSRLKFLRSGLNPEKYLSLTVRLLPRALPRSMSAVAIAFSVSFSLTG